MRHNIWLNLHPTTLQPNTKCPAQQIQHSPCKTISGDIAFTKLAGYTVHCMYNITVCTTTQLTGCRSHTSNTNNTWKATCIKAVTENHTPLRSKHILVSLHTKSILWIAHAAHSDVLKCLLGGAGFCTSLLHCATRLISVTHVLYII